MKMSPRLTHGDPSRRGVSLVELLLAASILALVLMGVHIMFASTTQLSEITRERDVAHFDAQSVVNAIRFAPVSDIVDRKYGELYEQDGETGVTVIGANPDLFSNDNTGEMETNLPEETVTIEFFTDNGGVRGAPYPLDGNASTGTVPRPLRFLVTVRWASPALKGERRTEAIEGVRLLYGIER